jgi:hypothetical protein
MSDMRIAWYVRSRQLARDFRFWSALMGMHPGDRSLSYRIYIVYAVIFFAIWGFLVLSLFADGAARALNLVSPLAPQQAAAALSLVVLLAWFLVSLYQAARRSPLRFNEEDQFLICQTPLNRSAVTLNWFVGILPRWGIPFWAGSVVLGFALAQIQTHNAGFSALPQYVLAGGRAVSILLVFHIALTACIWSFGLLRLQQKRAFPGLGRLAVGIALLLGGAVVWTATRTGLVSLAANLLFWPLAFPLQAAYGLVPWWAGLVFTAVVCAGVVRLLWMAGRQVSLGRAALETTRETGVENALLAGEMEAAAEMSLQGRLGEQHHPTGLAGRPGVWIMLWKDLLQSRRALSFSEVFNWVGVGGLLFLALWIPETGARILIAAYAGSLLSQQYTLRLRADLSRWWLLKALPLSKTRLLLAQLAFPWALATLLGWLAVLGVGTGTGMPVVLAALLLPLASAVLALTAAADLLRQSKTGLLIRGVPARGSMLGLAVGLLLAAVPWAVFWFNRQVAALGGLLALAAAGLLVYLALEAAVYFYEHIE